MVSCWQSCTFSHYWLNRFQLTEHDLAPISVCCNQLQFQHKPEQIWDNVSCFFLSFSACAFPWITQRHMCRKGCCPAAWNSSLLVLCSVNQVSWAVTTSLRIRARESLYLLICPTVLRNLITQMKQAQTISSYKIRNCIWQFLNKCIQVQLKAFQFCQVLVE